MVKNRDNIRVYGGDDSAVYKAPLASTPPTGLAVPADPWVDAGWLDEDGITEEQKVKTDAKRGHQGGAIVRTTFTEFERTFTFSCIEENAISFGWVYPGAEWKKEGSGNGAYATATLTDSPKIPATAFIIDEFEVEPSSDFTVQKRWIVPKGRVDLSTKVAHKYGEITTFEFTITPEGPVQMITNSPGVVDGAA